MKARTFQPVIEPERTLGASPYAVTVFQGAPLFPALPIACFGQMALGSNTPFAPSAPAELFGNCRPAAQPPKPISSLPVVKATGRIITQQEIDDALDD